MEQKSCIVCAKTYDTNAILLDKRLKASLDRHTITGLGMCPADQEKADQGFIALVECDPERSSPNGNIMKPEDAYRTGRIMHVKEKVFKGIFNISGKPTHKLAFIEIEAFDKLKNDYEKATK